VKPKTDNTLIEAFERASIGAPSGDEPVTPEDASKAIHDLPKLVQQITTGTPVVEPKEKEYYIRYRSERGNIKKIGLNVDNRAEAEKEFLIHAHVFKLSGGKDFELVEVVPTVIQKIP